MKKLNVSLILLYDNEKRFLLQHRRIFFLDKVPGVMHVFTEPYHGNKTKLRLSEGQGWGWFYSTELGDLKMLTSGKLDEQ
jgi:hypothetical protein